MAKKLGIYAGVKGAKPNVVDVKKTGSLPQRKQDGPIKGK